jgi:putative nucleotidyltransferase with HDIG domain
MESESVKVAEALETVLKVLESVIGARDPYTVYHQQRVARFACDLASEIGLGPDSVRALRMAGTIHDLGKIAIPAAILTKPGRLTNIEFAMIKNHPQIAFEILKPVRFPGQVSQIVLQHHERLNGSGYPLGLKGEEILLEARILGVADVVEAMCSHRPYRPSLGLEIALHEIYKHKGVLYDAAIVEACLKLYKENRRDYQRFSVGDLGANLQMSYALAFACPLSH